MASLPIAWDNATQLTRRPSMARVATTLHHEVTVTAKSRRRSTDRPGPRCLCPTAHVALPRVSPDVRRDFERRYRSAGGALAVCQRHHGLAHPSGQRIDLRVAATPVSSMGQIDVESD